MTTDEIVQTNENGEVTEAATEIPLLPPAEPVIIPDASATQSAEQTWQSFQAKASTLSADVIRSTVAFVQENRKLLSSLGWLLLAFVGTRVVLASLDAIDDIPLVTPILKLIGLGTVAWFIWRYMIRANNRQELVQMIDRTRVELLGNRD
ncbi:CAAD domain-containing protein [Leptolyngbya sp. FACHB-36]|uniref:CAAD domain-containing protein n=1 Tax=Leptolyngbya sp. FACHB-36 TaxID=2692808 RepID=UPI00167FFAE0|nr:CAAD domain-containing protein [Leptolyngbya sp. FACHB-36]MBD2021340.1 CAAD domain-containing protein [Leptolyngbya sp. FACHB-36]